VLETPSFETVSSAALVHPEHWRKDASVSRRRDSRKNVSVSSSCGVDRSKVRVEAESCGAARFGDVFAVGSREYQSDVMLLSRKHGFVFVHICKNAGTSIEQALRPFAVNRLQRELVRGLKNLRLPFPSAWDWRPFGDHVTAPELIHHWGQSRFDGYFSFAFVRNPWDWQVSLYSYVMEHREHAQHLLYKSFGGFERFLRWRCTASARQQIDFVSANRFDQVVSFVGRYENLEADFETVCRRIGIRARLARLNASRRQRDYRWYYSDQAAQWVRSSFAADIERFGYDFDFDARQGLAARPAA
jgi:hypothetical protein